MPSRWRADPGREVLGLLPAACVAAAEGAWVVIVYAAVQLRSTGQPLYLGLWEFVVAAACGLIASRAVGGRSARPVAALVVLLAALAGWLSDPTARGYLTAGAFGAASAQHICGLLLGLAAWRGARHVDPSGEDLRVGRLLAWATPALAVPWLVGAAGAERSAFVGLALPATMLFVATAVVAVGTTRLEALGQTVGVDWRGNRTWLALLTGTAAFVLILGAPVALLLGTSLESVLATILGPLGGLGAGVAAALRPVTDSLAGALGALGTSPHPAPTGTVSQVPPTGIAIPSWLTNGAALLAGVGLIGGGWLVWRRIHGAPSAPSWQPPPAEERRFVWPTLTLRIPKPVLRIDRFGRPASPTTASEAYLALLGSLESDERIARRPAESPAGHAHRRRAEGTGSLGLDLIAADFALERYAARRLTRPETRRAILRWRRSRAWPTRYRRPTQGGRRRGE